MNRWVALVVSVVVCWAAAMACSGSGMPADAPPPPPADCAAPPCLGLNADVPNSIYVGVPGGADTKLYRVDVQPDSFATNGTKNVKNSVKAKPTLVPHLKFDQMTYGGLFGISSFGELVVGGYAKGLGTKSSDYKVDLVGKEQVTAVMKNRSYNGFLFYDDARDSLFFTTIDPDGIVHLIQRAMDGTETELYKGKNLVVFKSNPKKGVGNTLFLHDDIGTHTLDLATHKTSKFADIPFYFMPIGQDGEFWITRKDGVGLQLTKSDQSKSYPLTPYDYTEVYLSPMFFRKDLNEFIFKVNHKEDTSPVVRLNLQDGSLKTLYTGLNPYSGITIFDHVNGRYLSVLKECETPNSATKTTVALQCTSRLAWLGEDGSLQDIVKIDQGVNVWGYNPHNETVLVRDASKLILYSTRDGAKLAELDHVVSGNSINVWPSSTNVTPLFVVFQRPEAAGPWNVGLLSPETWGGVDGKTLAPVALGQVPDNGGDAIYATQHSVHDLKLRSTPAVADPTKPPACVPACVGKECGDNGCGGVCGVCGGEKICNNANQCIEENKKQPAPVISGLASGTVAAVPENTTKKFETPISITSAAGLAAVVFECGDGKIEGVPAFDLVANKNEYKFNIQLSGMKLASMCAISATDSAGQSKQVSFSVTIGSVSFFK